ncbi:phage/plasmid primase, P4 family [Intestinibacillus massiliensis]|uniref:phage/plasmid primase, P4 family n=1 Tax=Intestinibacillus massiliensis TaxID=1871029 RepID=UPI001F225BF6|nr:phage/plasmid primase, P4 family [Intestinibacillus massiliensis]
MFTLYHADCIGQANNCLYPHRVEITDEASLAEAVSRDYVCAEYEGSYRNNDNFLGSDCLSVECDNDHSDDPKDWKMPADIAAAFPGVTFAVHYSRNHMKVKNGRTARPKFHAFFAIDRIEDAEEYSNLKKLVNAIFPYFDTKALDAARFYFGTRNPNVEVFPGDMTLTEFLSFNDFDAELPEGTHGGNTVIPEGSHNATMSRFAGRVIKKYGDSETAYQCFAEKCNPPLEQFELQTIWHSAQKFYAKVQQQDGYIAPEEYNRDYSLRPSDFSDIGQAKVLAREYAAEMVYTDATDYMRYVGTHWAESKQMAVGAYEEFLDRQLAEAILAVDKTKQALLDTGIGQDLISAGGKTLEKAIDDSSEKAFAAYCFALAYKAFVMKRRDMKYVTSALQAAKPMLLCNIQEFDTQEFLLNTPAATYDLRLGMSGAHDHCADDLITKMTTVSPSDEGVELWLSSVENFSCGDKELIDYVQQTVGLAAIGKVYQEALIIAYGEGSNGKSTFWNAIAKVLGTYSGSMSADALTVGCKRNVKPEMAELKGKRLVIAAELEEGMRLNTSIVKQLCSTDEVSAEKKYKDPFKYVPTHTLVLYTNRLPRVGANDDGTWRRLIVIPFNAKIRGKSDIKNYADYLVKNAGGAILAWIIEGAQKAIKNNFTLSVPQVVQNAITQYRDNNDWLSIFIEDCCEVDRTFTQKSGDLYQEYRAYCGRNGEYARSTTDFYTGLENAGFMRKKTKAGNVILGLQLKSDFLE